MIITMADQYVMAIVSVEYKICELSLSCFEILANTKFFLFDSRAEQKRKKKTRLDATNSSTAVSYNKPRTVRRTQQRLNNNPSSSHALNVSQQAA